MGFLLLIVGWTTQLYDERSRITQTAAELFPSLLTQLLSRMETPAIIFEEENGCLSTILEALFTLLKNKRAKTLAEIAHDVLIETINILSVVAMDLDETAYYKMIQFLCKHTFFEHEKHEKVRAGCIAYSLFIIYGTEAQESQNNDTLLAPQTLSKSLSVDSAASDNEGFVASDNENEEEKEKELTEEEKKKLKEKNVKIAKTAQRAFLFQDKGFMEIFAKIVGNGIEDRGKESREKAMKCLKKIESTNQEVLTQHIAEQHLNKYAKWKKFNAPKSKKGKKGSKKGKNKRISPIKRARTAAPKKLLQRESKGNKSVGDTLSALQNEQNDIDPDLNHHDVSNGTT